MPMFKRKRKFHKKSRKSSVAKKALSKAKYAIRLARKPVTYANVESTSTSLSQAGIVIEPCLMTQGDAQGERIGDSITLTSLYFRLQAIFNSGGTSHQEIRIMVVLDKQCNGAQYTTAELLNHIAASLVCEAPRNQEGYDRFSVLYDKKGSVDQYHLTKWFGGHWRFRNTEIRYESNLGTIADLVSKNLTVLMLTDESVNQPTVRFHLQMKYLP